MRRPYPRSRIPRGVGSQPVCFPRISPGVSDTQHCVNTSNTPTLFFFYSLRNWKRGWLSYLPIFSEQLISGRAKARVGSYSLSHCGVFPPFLLPCETLQKKKKKKAQTISLHSAAHFLKHTFLAFPDLKGLEC